MENDLLKPRYKVMADWPFNNSYNVGDIILMQLRSDGNYWNGNNDLYLREDQLRLYPHLFKKLEWWEDRKPEEMPKFLKDKENERLVYKVYGWLQNNGMFNFGPKNNEITHTEYFIPATLEEYQSKNTKPQIEKYGTE